MRASIRKALKGIPGLMQALSLIGLAVGFYMLAPWLGVVVGSLALGLAGWAYDGDGK